MKYAVASLFALLISLVSYSQKEKGKEYFLVDFSGWDSLSASDRFTLDSLLPLYHNAKNDTTRFLILNALTEGLNEERVWTQYNLIVHDQTDAILHSGKKLPKQEERAVKKYYASSLQTLGYYQENTMGNLPKAMEYYNQAKKIQEEISDLRGLGFTINNMAIVLQHEGNTTKALEYYMESLRIAESINEKQPIAYALNNVGTLYLMQGDTATALEYQDRALKIRQEIGDKQGVIYSLGNIGSLYKARKDFKKAIYYYSECYRISEENGQKQGMGYSKQHIATIYQSMWESAYKDKPAKPDSLFQRSMEYFTKSQALVEEIGDKRGITVGLYGIGKLYFRLNDQAKATDYAKRSFAMAREIGYATLIKNGADLLYKIYKQQGKAADALAMYELFILMRDSVSNEETKKSTFRQKTKYEYEKQKALSDLENQKVLAVAEEGKKRQQIVSYAVGGGLLMVALFAIFIFTRLQITRRQKFVIEDQKKTVEQKNKHITDSINYAKRIQDAVLPSGDEMRKSFPNHFIFFRPREIVSGDFFWMTRLPPQPPKRGTTEEGFSYETADPGLYTLLKSFVKEHRNNPTEAESIFWEFVREKKLGYKFRRQHIIGQYIADFVCLSCKLIVEIDGLIHELPDHKKTDEQRTSDLKKLGFHVIRFTNNEIIGNPDVILDRLINELKSRTAFLPASGGRGATVLAVADCTGHGVPGAFMSMIGNTLLNEIVNEQKIIQPAAILDHLNEGIVQALHQESRAQDDGMDISVCLVDHDTNTLSFAGANHSLFIVNGGSLSKISGDLFSIGSMFGKKTVSFTQKEVPLQKKMAVFLSTDGFVDQPGEKGKKFMIKRFEELLVSASIYESHEQKEMLKEAFENWKGTKEQIDDVLVMGIKL